MAKRTSIDPGPRAKAEDIARQVHRAAQPLSPLDQPEAFGAAFDRFADARVMLLGEATHGTSEFYRARAAITRRLITQHGFTIVAVEADWPDARRIDRYVRHHAPVAVREEAFARFPTWMWRNKEVLDFIEWLRRHNEERPPEARAEFRGLDIYSLRGSIAAVLAYLDKADPNLAETARRRYGCLTPWQIEPADYGRAVLHGAKDPCEDAIVAQLRDILGKRLEFIAQDKEAFFDAAQNARIVHAAERYYRTMWLGSTESWNLRDRHMFDTLQAVLRARGDDAKAVVWAHNSHIGNAAATEMGWSGEFNVGELCRTAYGRDAVLVGFGTDRGQVAAADDWDGKMDIKDIRPAREDSYEWVFREAGVPCALTEWRRPDGTGLREALSAPRLERAIGVIYRPGTERQSHYFEAVLPDQFDAFAWFEETRPVTPLPAVRPHGVPETYPFGV
jgi:erythromycin esterase-like protein